MRLRKQPDRLGMKVCALLFPPCPHSVPIFLFARPVHSSAITLGPRKATVQLAVKEDFQFVFQINVSLGSGVTSTPLAVQSWSPCLWRMTAIRVDSLAPCAGVGSSLLLQ